MWSAWKAAGTELVEALEKAQEVMNAVVTAAAIRGVRPFDGIDCDPQPLKRMPRHAVTLCQHASVNWKQTRQNLITTG